MFGDPVECAYCGHVTPTPGAAECPQCGESLARDLRGSLTSRPRTREQFAQMVGTMRSPGDDAGRIAPSTVRGVVAAIVVVALVVAAAVLLRSLGYLGAPRSAGAHRFDLCTSPLGPNCQGHQVSLPYSTTAGQSVNVSPCDPVLPNGSGARLQFNYTTSSSMYGVLIPSGYYDGASVSFLGDPAGFFQNAPALGMAAWNSGLVVGDHVVQVSVPAGFASWCLAWWNPGTLGVVTLAADVYLTYA